MKIASFYKKSPRIEMLPLIDIVFLLLVVFIYAMLSMAVHKGMPVDLPTSTQAQLEKQAPLSVTVNADGDIFVNKDPVVLDALTDTLVQLSQGDRQTDVLLFADRQVTYQALFRVLDRIRGAGLERISLQAEAPAGEGQ
jgi:biopolymer transport protein ExbD